MIWGIVMNSIVEALAKALNLSVDGVSEILSSIKDNTPQLYEQLVREWTYYTVLGKASGVMLIITGIIIAYTLLFRYILEIDPEYIDYKEVPESFSRNQYARILTQRNVNEASKTFRWLFTGITLSFIFSMLLGIAKYILAPNYSFLLNEILPKLVNK